MSNRTGRRYLALTLGVLVLALVGYLGYLVYPRFDLPAASGVGLLILATGAGVASFFSPCSFPLLVSTLARPQARVQTSEASVRPFRFAASFALGAAVFLLLLGMAIGLIGGTLLRGVTFTSPPGRILRAAVGLFLIGLGLIQLNRLQVSLRHFEPAIHGLLKRQARLRRSQPTVGFALFGFAYPLAGFG